MNLSRLLGATMVAGALGPARHIGGAPSPTAYG